MAECCCWPDGPASFGPVDEINSGTTIPVKVIPGAKRNEVSWVEDQLVVRTTAPDVDNKANEAVVKLVRAFLGVRVEVIRGAKSRVKVIRVV